jgi:hypothetical protein
VCSLLSDLDRLEEEEEEEEEELQIMNQDVVQI